MQPLPINLQLVDSGVNIALQESIAQVALTMKIVLKAITVPRDLQLQHQILHKLLWVESVQLSTIVLQVLPNHLYAQMVTFRENSADLSVINALQVIHARLVFKKDAQNTEFVFKVRLSTSHMVNFVREVSI